VERITVTIADEYPLVREGIAALCESTGRYQVVGHCEDGIAALRMVEALRPQIAILDLNLTRLHTLEVVRRAREFDEALKAVVLSTRRDRKSVLEVLRSGASGFVLKSGPFRHLVDALDQIRDGGVYVSPLLDLDKIFTSEPKVVTEDPLERLSSREYQVFSLMIDGVRAKEIAARLELSPKTVDTYRASLMRKLDIHDVAGLVKYAITKNLTTAS